MSNFSQNVPNHGFWNFNFLIFISKKKGNWKLLFIWMPALKFTEWSKKINGHMFNTKLEQSHIKSASKLYRLKYSGQKPTGGILSPPPRGQMKIRWRNYGLRCLSSGEAILTAKNGVPWKLLNEKVDGSVKKLRTSISII